MENLNIPQFVVWINTENQIKLIYSSSDLIKFSFLILEIII